MKIAKTRFYNRRRSPEAAKLILKAVLGQYGLDKKLERYEFIWRWAEVVGEDIAKRTKPESIQGNALIVRVESSAWAQELSLQKNVILRRFREIFKQDALKKGYVVNDIRFYVAGTSGANRNTDMTRKSFPAPPAPTGEKPRQLKRRIGTKKLIEK
jgi:hypothetical protein